MRCIQFLGFAASAAFGVASCGDNSQQCGPGTKDKDGVCTAVCGTGTKDNGSGTCVPDGSIVCTDGTKFDPTMMKCVIDPAACQDGTVLVHGACVDPGIVTADIEEAPEPNGLGVIEASAGPAGTITVGSIGGSGFVIHGHITPWRDANLDGQPDPDVDSYLMTVQGPTLLHITADGLNGIVAGFLALAQVQPTDPLASWARFGLSISGDTAKRQLFLPRAGTYIIAVADSRTLFQYSTGGPALAAPGGDNGDYYITIDQVDTPAPMALAVTGGTAGDSGAIDGETTRFYTVPLGTGMNDVQLAMPSDQANASLVALDNSVFRSVGDEQQVGGSIPVPAKVAVGGVVSTDTTLIVADYAYNYAIDPVDFTLSITTADALALSTTGASVTASATATDGSDVTKLNQFYVDVSAADVTQGMEITWSPAVVGQMYTQDGVRAATFTDPFRAPADPTWTTFRGLLRFSAPGRYYFLAYDPAATIGTTSITATSTITEITPDAITIGLPLAATAVNPFRSNPFTYDAGTDAWQEFDSTGAGTGGQTVGWYDPTTAYGRLDALTVTGNTTRAPDATAIFSHSFTAPGGAFGRILLDDATTHYYIKVNPKSGSAATFTLSCAVRSNMHDYGTIVPGATGATTGDTISHTLAQRFYLFRSAAGNSTTITVTPGSGLDTQFQRLDQDEAPLAANVDNVNGPDSETFIATSNGWTAFVVSSVTPLATTATYDTLVAPM